MRTDDADDVADGVGVHHLAGRPRFNSICFLLLLSLACVLANGRNYHRNRE